MRRRTHKELRLLAPLAIRLGLPSTILKGCALVLEWILRRATRLETRWNVPGATSSEVVAHDAVKVHWLDGASAKRARCRRTRRLINHFLERAGATSLRKCTDLEVVLEALR